MSDNVSLTSARSFAEICDVNSCDRRVTSVTMRQNTEAASTHNKLNQSVRLYTE